MKIFRISMSVGILTLIIVCLSGLQESIAKEPQVTVGVLKFGTVNWELNVVKHHKLDFKEGYNLLVKGFGGKNATAVSLQGGAVEAIVTDWIWVSRQRFAGRDYTFVPHSVAVGGLVVHPDAGINSLKDLRGKKVGIAGGPVDKSWLMLRAFAKKSIGIDLKEIVEPVFAAPPLLNKFMLKGEIPAVLNFWHYGARLKAAGMKEVVRVIDLLPGLGVKRRPPLIGWVFSEVWAKREPKKIQSFLRSLRAAKTILEKSDAEWERIKPVTKAKNESTFIALRNAYRLGIPHSFGDEDVAAAETLFKVLAKYGGKDLVGNSTTLTPGTFWSGFRY